MSFTRFHDDPCRIQKYLDESTYVGNYGLNVPGNSDKLYYLDDPHLRMQKWGGNLSENKTRLESDLFGITRNLNRDTIKENNYTNFLNSRKLYNIKEFREYKDEITHQPRATNPAWTVREIDSINTPNIPNNFNYLHLNPQEHVCIPFQNNISSRIVEKDYYTLTNYNKEIS